MTYSFEYERDNSRFPSPGELRCQVRDLSVAKRDTVWHSDTLIGDWRTAFHLCPADRLTVRLELIARYAK